MPRRRLAQWIEKGEKRYGVRIKPFWLERGTYGYQTPHVDYENVMRWGTAMSATDVITTLLCILSTGKVDALVSLVSGIPLTLTLDHSNWEKFQQTGSLADLFHYESNLNGFSGIFSYNGGWLLAQYLFVPSSRKRWAPLVGGLFILIMNIWAYAKGALVNHFAHFMGMAQGFAVGAAMAFAQPKKVGLKFLQRHDKWLALATPGLYFLIAFFAWMNVDPALVEGFRRGDDHFAKENEEALQARRDARKSWEDDYGVPWTEKGVAEVNRIYDDFQRRFGEGVDEAIRDHMRANPELYAVITP